MLYLALLLYVSLSISFSFTIVDRLPAKEGKKNIKKLLQNTTLEVCEKENKNENKEKEIEKENK